MFETFLEVFIVIIMILDFIQYSIQSHKINSGLKEAKKKYKETEDICKWIEKKLKNNADKIEELKKLSNENKKLKETNLEQAQTIERQKIYHRKNKKLEEENRKLKEELEGGEEDEENDNYRIDGISVGNGRV